MPKARPLTTTEARGGQIATQRRGRPPGRRSWPAARRPPSPHRPAQGSRSSAGSPRPISAQGASAASRKPAGIDAGRDGSTPSTPLRPARSQAPLRNALPPADSTCSAAFGAATATRSSLREAQQFRRAGARGAGREPSRCRGPGGPAAAHGAGTRGRRAARSPIVPPPQLQRLSHLVALDRLEPARSAIVRASRSTRSWARPLRPRRA